MLRDISLQGEQFPCPLLEDEKLSTCYTTEPQSQFSVGKLTETTGRRKSRWEGRKQRTSPEDTRTHLMEPQKPWLSFWRPWEHLPLLQHCVSRYGWKGNLPFLPADRVQWGVRARVGLNRGMEVHKYQGTAEGRQVSTLRVHKAFWWVRWMHWKLKIKQKICSQTRWAG